LNVTDFTATNFTTNNLVVNTSSTFSGTSTFNNGLTSLAKIIATTIRCSSILYFDSAELVSSQVFSSRHSFNNSGAIVGNRSFEFSFGANPAVVTFEQTLLTYGAPSTTNSNVALTGTAQLSLASGTSLSLASGSSMSSAGNITLTSTANLTTSASGVFFNSGQDISIKAVLGQMQFNIANTSPAPRSYQFRLALVTPLLIEATQITQAVKSICSAGADFTTTDTIPILQALGTTATTSLPVLRLVNQLTSPTSINFLLNAIAGVPNPLVQVNENVLYSTSNSFLLTTSSTTNVGVRITTNDVGIRGDNLNCNATTNNINGTTCNITSPTTTITGTTTNLNSTNTNINGSSCVITGPQTTSTADAQLTIRNSVSPTANTIQFACNLGAGGYNPIVQGGDSAIFSTFGSGTSKLVLTSWSTNAVGIRIEAPTSSVTISGTTALMNATNNIVQSVVSGASATPPFIIRNANSTGLINFLPNATATSLNPIVGLGDSVIASGPSGATDLTLTTNSTTNVGIRIVRTGFVDIDGITTTITTNNSAVTSTPSLIVANSAGTDWRIAFINNASAGAVNPIVQAGDNIVYASSNVGATARNLVLTTTSLATGGIRIDGTTNQTTIPTAVTQARTENGTNVATTAYVNRANVFTDPTDIYFNVGIGGGSGTINLKRMAFDPIYATSNQLVNSQMNFTAIRLDQGVTYTGVTTYWGNQPAGAQLRIGLYDINGALVVSTATFTNPTLVASFHSMNFSATYTPTSNITLWIGSHILVSTTSTQSSFLGGASTNPSPVPTTALCAGRSFTITKPATFPTTLNGIAKTQLTSVYWFALY
jgi:hypothetical protein